MGVDTHGLNFLRHAAGKAPFGSTLTLGRQSIYIERERLAKLPAKPGQGREEGYCEWLLEACCGASSVESMDFSDYEHATHIHNMNLPVGTDFHGRYDTIFDGGTLEHIYNVPQALRNISEMCRVNGQIIHVVPANNQCGHGFWQFSPELFFSLYSKANGYKGTEVFLADMSDVSKWYRVKEPANGMRAEVKSDYELIVLVRTFLASRDFSHEKVQQSDYVHRWTGGGHETAGLPETNGTKHPVKRMLGRHPSLYRTAQSFYRPLGYMIRLAEDMRNAPRRLRIRSTEKLDGNNPWLEAVSAE